MEFLLLLGVVPVEKLACATLLHDLGSGEASELTKAIRAVDDGVVHRHLGIAQDKVAVWKKERKGVLVLARYVCMYL